MKKSLQCKGQTPTGTRCKNHVTHHSGLCHLHRIIMIAESSDTKRFFENKKGIIPTYKFPPYHSGGEIISDEATISFHPRRAKNNFKLIKHSIPWIDIPGRGGMCGSCKNEETDLIHVSSRGDRSGSNHEYEFYCPKCKKFTLIEREVENY